MTQEFFDIREQFNILAKLAKQIDTVHEIRNIYGTIDNMTVSELEEFLTQRYTKIEIILSKIFENTNESRRINDR